MHYQTFKTFQLAAYSTNGNTLIKIGLTQAEFFFYIMHVLQVLQEKQDTVTPKVCKENFTCHLLVVVST
jgi:hypothetical protein